MQQPSASLLQDKVAIVTGGGGGIGRGISSAFAELGASVVIAEKDTERAQAAAGEITAQGGEAIT